VTSQHIDQEKKNVTVGILLGDVTEVLDLGLQTPVPLVLHQQRVLVEVSIAELAL
jgi:hypothetical protein